MNESINPNESMSKSAEFLYQSRASQPSSLPSLTQPHPLFSFLPHPRPQVEAAGGQWEGHAHQEQMYCFPQTSSPGSAHLLSGSLSKVSLQAQHLPVFGAQECRLAHHPTKGPAHSPPWQASDWRARDPGVCNLPSCCLQ